MICLARSLLITSVKMSTNIHRTESNRWHSGVWIGKERIRVKICQWAWLGASAAVVASALAYPRPQEWNCHVAWPKQTNRQLLESIVDGSMDYLNQRFRCGLFGNSVSKLRSFSSSDEMSCVTKVIRTFGTTLFGAYAKSLADWAAPGGGGGGGAGSFGVFGCFGIVVSPSTMFTKQYSINAMNTKIVHTDIKASTAFRYDTGGSEACDLACWVDNVSNDVTENNLIHKTHLLLFILKKKTENWFYLPMWHELALLQV